MAILEAVGLTKFYGRLPGIVDLDMAVQEGEVFGFIGPNGAGKTTTLRLFLGFLKPSRGQAIILGKDAWRHGVGVRREVGFLPDTPAFPPNLTGQEALDLLGRLQGKPPILRRRWLDGLELPASALRRSVRGYSTGMRQKLCLVQAFQHDPLVALLDEPTEALDPLMQNAFFALLQEFVARGRTVLFSSHILPQVERACQRVAIVRENRLVTVETIDALRRRAIRSMEVLLKEDSPVDLHLSCVVSAQRDGRRLSLKVQGDITPLLARLAQVGIADMVYEPARLEDIFLSFYTPQQAPTANGRL
ncbi:MAG: ABC transporter ATP-binding protein [Dehalococcoidia bacterium]